MLLVMNTTVYFTNTVYFIYIIRKVVLIKINHMQRTEIYSNEKNPHCLTHLSVNWFTAQSTVVTIINTSNWLGKPKNSATLWLWYLHYQANHVVKNKCI